MIAVLDHGFVRLVNFMGDDSAVVEKARESVGGGTSKKQTREYIRDLMRWGHNTPFEFVQFVFEMKMPIFVARQIVRHRTSSIVEVSGRYTQLPPESYTPAVHRFDSCEDAADLHHEISQLGLEQEVLFSSYQRRMEKGWPKELARVDLPLALYTKWFWRMDLHNLLHFLKLRLDAHAQWETRQYAEAILALIRPIVPFCVEAFEDYRLKAVTLSGPELQFLQQHVVSHWTVKEQSSKTALLQSAFPCESERKEFDKKLAVLANTAVDDDVLIVDKQSARLIWKMLIGQEGASDKDELLRRKAILDKLEKVGGL